MSSLPPIPTFNIAASLPTTITPPVTPTYPNAPGSVPLTLGAVQFYTAECPDVLPIGGAEQMQVVHTLIGGGRVIQSFGISAKDISWSGRFFDVNIVPRCKQLRAYMVSAQELYLSWGSERYYVKIKSFDPKFRGGYAEYEITLTVTRDANGAFALSSQTSIDQQVQALQAQINTANYNILNPTLTTASAISAQQSAAAYQQSITNLNNAINAAGPIAMNITTTGPTITSFAQQALAAINNFQSGLDATTSAFSNALMIQGSINAIIANVARGQNPLTLTTQGTSLFTLAATQYGDVTKAFSLASFNKLPSPFTSSLSSTTVSLPPYGP